MAIYAALNNGESEFDRQLFSYNAPLKIIVDKDGKLESVEAEELLRNAFL